jgi:hypothetical protein
VPLFLTGFVNGLNDLFLYTIGPLILAAKNRKSYEITLGGTLLGICICVPYITSTLMRELLIIFGNTFESTVQHIVVACLLWFGVIPFLPEAHIDWHQLDCRRKNSDRSESSAESTSEVKLIQQSTVNLSLASL